MTKPLIFSLLTIIFCSTSIFSNAQTTPSPFTHYQKFKSSDSSKLFFRIENFNFIKNNEYSGDFIDGETLIGYIASPKLSYYANSQIRIEAGVRLQKFSGLNDFTEAEPLLSVHYQPNQRHSLILGSLNQNHNHGLFEPIFEPERFYSQTGENGLQYIYQSERLHFDTWLNWEQYIFSGDPFSEVFTHGISAKFLFSKPNSNSKLHLPLQSIISHRGGEIDNSQDPVQTMVNVSSGLQFERQVNGLRIKSWGMEALAYYFLDDSTIPVYTFDKGHAFASSLWISTTKSKVQVGYWNGFQFVSARGSQLFQSISSSRPDFREARRELLTAKYNYSHKIGQGIHLGARIDFYYDLHRDTAEHAAAIYLSFNQNFFLKKIRDSE